MWDSLIQPWRACFEEAWNSYRHGSIPIGAVLVRHDGEIVFRGRNRVKELTALDNQNQLFGTRMAHAEMNVLTQVKGSDSSILADHTLYTTTEPCVLCFGAVVMSGVRTLVFAANDPVAGGTDLNLSTNSFIRSRKIDVQQAPEFIGNVQRVIRTVFVLQYLPAEKAEEILQAEGRDHPYAISLGRRWFHENKLHQAVRTDIPFGQVFDDIVTALDRVGNS